MDRALCSGRTRRPGSGGAFTLWDLLIVIAVGFVLVCLLLLPSLACSRCKSDGGSREASKDPTAIYRHFLALSNELSTPKLVMCPTDTPRRIAPSFEEFKSNDCLSYFANVGNHNDPGLLAGDRNVLTLERPSLRVSAIVPVHEADEHLFS